MATILLQAAGAYLGGLFGTVGAAIGTAAGALAGYAIDQTLINGTKTVDGPRLSGARPFSAEEGSAIPRLYGTARLGGIMIWATRFEEVNTTKRQGGKASGGAKVTEHSYFANVAFALCEGQIAGVRRIWADGREIDRNGLEMRVYAGTPTQMPDPLIEARQGAGNAPAYRDLAYVVFERFPIGDYGNRIPQLQFEVLRPVGRQRLDIRSVALIPGSTEYGLEPALVTKTLSRVETQAENRHVLFGATDLDASLDELQMLCPNLQTIALVVSWFGDDLRAGVCRIRPGVTDASDPGFSQVWKSSGITRDSALVVSRYNGAAAYGGTPSDPSVIHAIQVIRARGLKVTLYPFIMMDVPAGNTLPDPYGASAQAPYPWRGRITCSPGPALSGSADKTTAARTQVEAFCGSATAGQFAATGDTVNFTGSPSDWGYRRFLLHFAKLAAAAGGVDAFLVGSELRGLTTLRDSANAFPFVETLGSLADSVKATLGSATKVIYAADWSEYFGHYPPDGSGDVFFHLDPLWSRSSIDAVGIDNYMPLSDWRDEDRETGNPDGATGPHDLTAMHAGVAGGEGFDWFYASEADRTARVRTPITDGAYGKPWVFRYKDLVGWWSNQHFDRIGGVQQGSPTAWTPRSKPLWFTELGCPAIDKGTNQPNVFVDPKSSESFVPYFSTGARSDLAQKRYLDAMADIWMPGGVAFTDAANPVSPVYGGRMVDPQNLCVWCWDARPFPAFPKLGGVWADGLNWNLGHWLNGRLEGATLHDIINAILADHGLPPADALEADGTLHGYVVDDPGHARAAIEPIVDLFGLAVMETGDGLVFRTAMNAGLPLAVDAMVFAEEPVVESVRSPDHELPAEAVLAYRDPMSDFASGLAHVFRTGAAGRRQQGISLGGVMEAGQAEGLAGDWLDRIWAERETATFSAANYRANLEPGALITLPGREPRYLITEVEDGLVRRIKARRLQAARPPRWPAATPGDRAPPALVVGHAFAAFLDLPIRSATAAPQDQFRIAVKRIPWRTHVVLASPDSTGFTLRSTLESPADMGELVDPLPPGSFEGRVDRSATVRVNLYDGEATSIARAQLLNGGNAAAVRAANGVWEVLQFETTEEVSAGLWRLAGLLRGQLGTADAMISGAAAGANFVMLNDRVKPAGLGASEIGLALNWMVGPAGSEISSAQFSQTTQVGGLRSLLPLSPVHLRCTVASGDLAFSWIRRSRVDADDWAVTEIPLGEEREAYRIDVAAAGGGAVVRSVEVEAPSWTYPATQVASDFGTLPAAIDITVRQLSVAAGWGLAATRRFAF